MCVWHFSSLSGVTNYLGETWNGNIPPGTAKLCKIPTLQGPEKEVLHFTYVTPQKKERKRNNIRSPALRSFHQFISIDAHETERGDSGPWVRFPYSFYWIDFLSHSRWAESGAVWGMWVTGCTNTLSQGNVCLAHCRLRHKAWCVFQFYWKGRRVLFIGQLAVLSVAVGRKMGIITTTSTHTHTLYVLIMWQGSVWLWCDHVFCCRENLEIWGWLVCRASQDQR